MPMIRVLFMIACWLLLWAGVLPVWSQTISVLPKEDLLLVGGDFRIRSVYSNIAGANEDGGGESGGFPDDQNDTKSFLDTRLRLYWDFRPNDLLRVHYRMEIGDVVFGGGVSDGSDLSGNLLPAIGPGSGGGVGADGINVETKNLFLEFQIPAIAGLRFKGGIFGYGDRFDFNILADDFAGLQILYERGDIAAHIAYLKVFRRRYAPQCRRQRLVRHRRPAAPGPIDHRGHVVFVLGRPGQPGRLGERSLPVVGRPGSDVTLRPGAAQRLRPSTIRARGFSGAAAAKMKDTISAWPRT